MSDFQKPGKLAFMVTKNISIDIVTMQRVIEFFHRHSTCPYHWMATESFWSPQGRVTEMFLVTVALVIEIFGRCKISIPIGLAIENF
jgi:hypothetical protein